MRNLLVLYCLLSLACHIGVARAAGEGSTAATVFAVGDVADCDPRNPDVASASGMEQEELAEHGLKPSDRLPGKPLGIEDLIEDQEGIVLGLGDLAYPAGTPQEYSECFAKVWGPLLRRIHPVVGNHEMKSGGEGYKHFWQGAAGEPGNYYSFDYGRWHFVALNSEISAAPGSPQDIFLRNDLESAGDRCVLAFFHRPAFASLRRSHDVEAKNLFRLLDAGNAAIVLNGHNHYYERMQTLDGSGSASANGIRGFIVGTGGRPENYGKITPASFSEKLIVDQTGFLKLDLAAEHYSWQFISAPSGVVLDSGTGGCRARPPLQRM